MDGPRTTRSSRPRRALHCATSSGSTSRAWSTAAARTRSSRSRGRRTRSRTSRSTCAASRPRRSPSAMRSRTRRSSPSASGSTPRRRRNCSGGSTSTATRTSRRSTARTSAGTEAASTSVPSRLLFRDAGVRLRHLGRNVLDLAADDVGADLVDLGDVGRRHLRRDPADVDAVVLEAEDDVPALELAVDDELDGVVDGRVDPLHRARQDVRAEEGLVGVDPDAPHVLLLRSVERAEAAAAGDLEDHASALLDLVQRDLLALRLVGEVLRVPVQRLDAGIRCLGTGLVTGDEAVDRRLLLAADGADDVRPRPTLLLEPGEIADEIPRLLLLEQQAEQVLRLAGLGRLVDVDDREVRVRKALRGGGDRLRLREADADRQLVALARKGRQVWDVILRRLRLIDRRLDP